MANAPTSSFSTLSFLPQQSSSKFVPRLGKASVIRDDGNIAINIETPGLLTTTSRGVIPHLSQDHYRVTRAIQWIHVPFETFLEQHVPVPTLLGGSNALHKFLGFSVADNALLMSVRDPFDGRELPPNGKDHISAYSTRGVRKISPSTWRSHILACNPDIVIALSDTPYTKPPHSQKRLTKSLERSTAWLSDILRPLESSPNPHPLNVLVHMVGGTSVPARSAFAENLTETLYGKEAEAITPYKRLDDGVKGYVFDLVPLRLSLAAENHADAPTTPPDILDTSTAPASTQAIVDTSEIVPLIQASLGPLPVDKLRLVNSALSPHEILHLVRDVGIDIFDAHWAQRAADIGIALDFRFPMPEHDANTDVTQKRNLGVNLYDSIYAHDFSTFATCFLDGASSLASETSSDTPICPCVACSPVPPATHISHSSLDWESYTESSQSAPKFLPPYTRAYIHHLLHTHEMSSHSLLAMHNISVLDAFMSGIRAVLAGPDGESRFKAEVDKFCEGYDEGMSVFEDARKMWTDVELARGKGRLAREREKQNESTLGTAVEL